MMRCVATVEDEVPSRLVERCVVVAKMDVWRVFLGLHVPLVQTFLGHAVGLGFFQGGMVVMGWNRGLPLGLPVGGLPHWGKWGEVGLGMRKEGSYRRRHVLRVALPYWFSDGFLFPGLDRGSRRASLPLPPTLSDTHETNCKTTKQNDNTKSTTPNYASPHPTQSPALTRQSCK